MIPFAYLKIGAAAVCVTFLGFSHWTAYKAGKSTIQSQWNIDKLKQSQALAAQEAAHRARERELGEAITSVSESLRREQEALQDELETVIADRDAGTLRLRDDLRGCRAQLSRDTAAATGDHGAGGGGLSSARQDVALRIGADCDAVALKLTAAQEYIRAIQ